MPKTKNFPLGSVVSITTGKLVASGGISDVYDILDWMTGEYLFTHELPDAAQEARPVLLKAFPQLADIEVPALEAATLEPWLASQIAKYGNEFAVPKLTEDEHV